MDRRFKAAGRAAQGIPLGIWSRRLVEDGQVRRFADGAGDGLGRGRAPRRDADKRRRAPCRAEAAHWSCVALNNSLFPGDREASVPLEGHERVRAGCRGLRSRSSPPRSGRSTRNAAPATSPPERVISFAAASAVPPVAMRSSTIRMRSPGLMASSWISMMSTPYSSVILLPDGLPRQLALLADRDEAATQAIGHGPAEDEAARLDPGHGVDAAALVGRRHALDRRLEALGIAKQRRHVPEQDSGLGIVRKSCALSAADRSTLPPRSQIAGAKYQYLDDAKQKVSPAQRTSIRTPPSVEGARAREAFVRRVARGQIRISP